MLRISNHCIMQGKQYVRTSKQHKSPSYFPIPGANLGSRYLNSLQLLKQNKTQIQSCHFLKEKEDYLHSLKLFYLRLLSKIFKDLP